MGARPAPSWQAEQFIALETRVTCSADSLTSAFDAQASMNFGVREGGSTGPMAGPTSSLLNPRTRALAVVGAKTWLNQAVGSFACSSVPPQIFWKPLSPTCGDFESGSERDRGAIPLRWHWMQFLRSSETFSNFLSK